MEFTTEEFKNFRVDANILFKTLQDKYNVNISLGKINYSLDGHFNVKMEVTKKSVNGKSFEENNWNKNCLRFGLKPEWFGNTIILQNKTFKIIGLDAHKPKNLITLSNGEKQFSCSARTIINYFNNLLEL